MRPQPGSYPVYFDNYISLVKEPILIEALENSGNQALTFFQNINLEKENYAYASGKWTVKQVLCHINDTERIFAYRALCFARNEKQVLPAFEEDEYVKAASLEHLTLTDLIADFKTIRESSISLFGGLSAEELLRTGAAASGQTTVLAMGFAISGHLLHHLTVLKQRYICE